jgi:hypothetical protein
MGAFVRSLDELRDALRCHVLAVHHSGKETSRGSRGHSLLRCAIDTEIEVTRDAATGIATATVTKQRDGPTEGKIAFRLARIELGRDQEDEPVTSCVIEPAEIVTATARSAKSLSAAQRRALDLLGNAIATAGEIPASCAHIPPTTRCVSERLWRRYCYDGGISMGDQNAKQKAFKRASEALIADGRVGCWNNWVWTT